MINWSNWTQQQKLLAVAGIILLLAARFRPVLAGLLMQK